MLTTEKCLKTTASADQAVVKRVKVNTLGNPLWRRSIDQGANRATKFGNGRWDERACGRLEVVKVNRKDKTRQSGQIYAGRFEDGHTNRKSSAELNKPVVLLGLLSVSKKWMCCGARCCVNWPNDGRIWVPGKKAYHNTHTYSAAVCLWPMARERKKEVDERITNNGERERDSAEWTWRDRFKCERWTTINKDWRNEASVVCSVQCGHDWVDKHNVQSSADDETHQEMKKALSVCLQAVAIHHPGKEMLPWVDCAAEDESVASFAHSLLTDILKSCRIKERRNKNMTG